MTKTIQMAFKKDVRLVQEKLALCYEDGQKQLQQVQEFLFVLAKKQNSIHFQAYFYTC